MFKFPCKKAKVQILFFMQPLISKKPLQINASKATKPTLTLNVTIFVSFYCLWKMNRNSTLKVTKSNISIKVNYLNIKS